MEDKGDNDNENKGLTLGGIHMVFIDEGEGEPGTGVGSTGR